MNESTMVELIANHFAVAGKDEVAAGEIFADDAVIEWPQSGERIRGKQQIIALHEAAPFAVSIAVRRTIGSGDLWVTETTIRYDGARPTNAVFIMEFRDGKVVRGPITSESHLRRPPIGRRGWNLSVRRSAKATRSDDWITPCAMP